MGNHAYQLIVREGIQSYSHKRHCSFQIVKHTVYHLCRVVATGQTRPKVQTLLELHVL